MNYLTRVVRPDLLRPACEYFDKKVFETASTKLDLPSIVTNEAYTLLTQPIRLGGFGLRPMVNVSPAALWSSFCQAAPDIAVLVQSRLVVPLSEVVSPPPASEAMSPSSQASTAVPAPAVPAPRASTSGFDSSQFLEAASALPCTRAATSCHKRLVEAGVKPMADVFPDKPTDLWTWYGKVGANRGLQKLLVAEVENERASRLLQEAQGDLYTVARLTGAQSKLAGVWLTTLPVSKDQFLSDNHFRMATRLRLGLPPQDDLPRPRVYYNKIPCTSSHVRS